MKGESVERTIREEALFPLCSLKPQKLHPALFRTRSVYKCKAIHAGYSENNVMARLSRIKILIGLR